MSIKYWIKTIGKAMIPKAKRYRLRICYHNLKMLNVKRQDFENKEGVMDYNYILFKNRERHGVSAILRVKNEEEKIYYCLMSIIDIFDEIVFVDNGSEDRTLEIVREFKRQEDREDKIKIYYYPFKIARCGSEHFNTPEDSLYSLAYYYNWTLSHCTFNYVCKWDADMILKKEAKDYLIKFFQKVQKEQKKCWCFCGQTAYRDLNGNYYLAIGDTHEEIRVFPYGFNTRFYKGEKWEIIKSWPPLPVETIEGITYYELRFANKDEYSNWSPNDSVTLMNSKVFNNYQLLKQKKIESASFEKLPPGFAYVP